jgi:hypothetical protein
VPGSRTGLARPARKLSDTLYDADKAALSGTRRHDSYLAIQACWLDNVTVVDDLYAAMAFFAEPSVELEQGAGRRPLRGPHRRT